jgi:hypothetical protein
VLDARWLRRVWPQDDGIGVARLKDNPFSVARIVAGTPAISSLVAIREDGPIAARTLRATLITASAIYGASLLAYWLEVFGESWSTILAALIVAASSWLVIPGLVALLRSG